MHCEILIEHVLGLLPTRGRAAGASRLRGGRWLGLALGACRRMVRSALGGDVPLARVVRGQLHAQAVRADDVPRGQLHDAQAAGRSTAAAWLTSPSRVVSDGTRRRRASSSDRPRSLPPSTRRWYSRNPSRVSRSPATATRSSSSAGGSYRSRKRLPGHPRPIRLSAGQGSVSRAGLRFRTGHAARP
jgi:hypothetical protein